MSKIAFNSNPLGTGTFTIASPNSNTDRTLTLPDTTGTVLTSAGGTMTDTLNVQSGNLNVGATSNYGGLLSVNRVQSSGIASLATFRDASAGTTLDIETYGDPAFGTVNRIKYSGPYLAIRGSSNDHLRIDSSGRVTMPYQPAFQTNGAGYSNSANQIRAINPSASLNTGSHYNATNGRFTAPVAGRYIFHLVHTTASASAPAPSLYFRINGSGTHGRSLNYYTQYSNATSVAILSLNAGDYVEAIIESWNSVATSTWEVSWGGYLIG